MSEQEVVLSDSERAIVKARLQDGGVFVTRVGGWSSMDVHGVYLSEEDMNALCLWWVKRHPELVKPSLTEEERDIIESTAFYHENIAKGYRKGSDADVSHSHQAEVLRSLLERTK